MNKTNSNEKVFTRIKDIEITYFPDDDKVFSDFDEDYSGEGAANSTVERHLKNLNLFASPPK